jgi:tetratricopeptide (TPR) repeat protein
MKHARLSTLLLVLSAACSSTEHARHYEGFDGYRREITTSSPEAQAMFDQGIQLLYGYNHDEAIRSFRQVVQLDPDCVMGWWGVAYANGLHINKMQMDDRQSREAYSASREALARIEHGAPVEQALARAVATRYENPNPEDRTHLDQAYADAMEAVWFDFPKDADVGALFAESLMDLQPWDYWSNDGEPIGRTTEVVAVLEEVMGILPDHPGANHFYVHTVEASPDPDRALAAADRLVDLVPGSGHLVHMPFHIYTRTGRYGDAADANVRAIAADKAYFAFSPPPDFYSIYYIHNVHCLAYSAMMEGRFETAMAAARQLEEEVPEDFLREYVGFADGLMGTPIHVMIRFGKWNEILAEPEADDYRLLSRAQRRYGRAVALAALGRAEEARAELAVFDELAAEVPEGWSVGNNSSGEVLALARQMMLGEILFREGAHDEAFEALAKGAQMEDDLVYDEPPGWMQPVRHAWGALLMSAGRSAEAEKVYRDDLERNRDNGWSLLGLEQALRAQGKTAGAVEAVAAREVAWRRADVSPTSSCYCEP